MRRTILAVVVPGSGLARAQTVAPPETPVPASARTAPAQGLAPAEDGPAERAASDLYEEAIRANAEGKRLIAQELANQALDVSPHGRYAASIRRFLDRLTTESLLEQPPPNPGTPTGSRVGYVLSAGILGAIAGTTGGFGLSIQRTYDTESFNGSVIAAMALVGTTLGIAAGLLSMGAVTDGAIPAQMWAGATLAVWLATATVVLAQNLDVDSVSAIYGLGIAAGAVAGAVIGATTRLTAGDGLAGMVLGNLLTLDGLVIESIGGGSSTGAGASVLILSLIGYLGGELLNSQIHWSSGRWGLILLSTLLGAGLGAVIAVAATSSDPRAPLLVGSLLGFGAGCLATLSLGPEGPRAGLPPSEARDLAARPMGPRAMLSFAF